MCVWGAKPRGRKGGCLLWRRRLSLSLSSACACPQAPSQAGHEVGQIQAVTISAGQCLGVCTAHRWKASCSAGAARRW